MAKPLVLVLALVGGAACENNKSKLDEPAAVAGSPAALASGSSGSGSAAALAGCPDSEIKPRLEEALVASKRYFTALKTHSATWGMDCEAVRKDLESLESEGDVFAQAMTVMKTWGRTISADCRARIETLGEANPITTELEAGTPALEARIKPVLERCDDHPGFRDAARKALRLAKKKQP